MASTYRLTAPRRILNALMRALLRLGIAPRGTYKNRAPFAKPTQLSDGSLDCLRRLGLIGHVRL
jgi:hypothetical protein